MNMYLATIFGLCFLATPSLAAGVSPAQFWQFAQETQPQQDAPPSGSPQEPAQNTSPASPAQEPSQPSAEPKPEPPPPAEAAPAPDAQQPRNTQPEAPAKKPVSKGKASTSKHRHRKPAAAAKSCSTPEKKVIRNGGTTDPAVQLAPGMSADQASSQRQNTSQLLAATDANLKQISARQLNPTQQDSVSQIRKYMEQAKAAEDAGDVQRAHNLASKAVLLSDDLVKH